MKRTRIISRTFETIFGVIGSIIGIFSGSFLIFIESLGHVLSASFLLIAGISALFRK